MKLFLDTNVILDFLAARTPWSFDAAELFLAAEKKQLSLATSIVSMVHCLFILRSRYNPLDNAKIILEVLEYVEIVGTTGTSLKKALSSGFSDKEGAIQYFSALDNGNIDYIITRDTKGFSLNEVPIITPNQFIKQHLKK